jgi:3-isopropylmalate dehydratase small subunit
MPTPYTNFAGFAAPLPLANINTDVIIPAPYLRTADADLASGLFARWRYDEDGTEQPNFVLNREPFRRASILFAGPNFGCGSSREAAAWALVRFGIRCVAAPSFADIFYENAFRNGLLPAVVAPPDLQAAVALAEGDPASALFTVDLSGETITAPNGHRICFAIPIFRREALLRGDDEIATTLRYETDIATFMARDRAARPWIHSLKVAS